MFAADPMPALQPLEWPRDDGPHFNAPVEWWYWHGHLKTPTLRPFSFHLAFFRLFERGRPHCLGHFSLLDHVTLTRHVLATRTARGVAMNHGGLQARVGALSVVDGVMLHALGESAEMTLKLTDIPQPVLHHARGFQPYEVGGFTWYYSRPRVPVTGSVTVAGNTDDVTGHVWFDHQWGALQPQMFSGWDWFGIQLEDGRDIMLFFRHLGAGRFRVGATVVDAQGNVRVLDDGAVGMEATRRWCSPHTGAEYPVEWRVAVEGEVWTVDAVLTDQEFVAPGMSYWEGAAVVRGAVSGRAFVELVGAPLHQANVHLLDPGGF